MSVDGSGGNFFDDEIYGDGGSIREDGGSGEYKDNESMGSGFADDAPPQIYSNGAYGDDIKDEDYQKEDMEYEEKDGFCGKLTPARWVLLCCCLGGVVAGIVLGVQSRTSAPTPAQIEEDPTRGPQPASEPTSSMTSPATSSPTPLPAIPEDQGECFDLCGGRGGQVEDSLVLEAADFPKFASLQSMIDVSTCGRLQDNLDKAVALFSTTAPGILACTELQKLGTYCGCNDSVDANPPILIGSNEVELCGFCDSGSELEQPYAFINDTNFESISGFRPDCQFWQDWVLSNYAQSTDECDANRVEASPYCSCSSTASNYPTEVGFFPTGAPLQKPTCTESSALHELYFIGNIGEISGTMTIKITQTTTKENSSKTVFEHTFYSESDIKVEGEQGIFAGCLQRQECFDVTIKGGKLQEIGALESGTPVEWGLWSVPDSVPVASGLAQPGNCSFSVPAKRQIGKELVCENTCTGDELSRYTPAPTPTSQLLMPQCNKKAALHVLSFTGVEDDFSYLEEGPGVFLSDGGHFNLTEPEFLDPVEFIQGVSPNTYWTCLRRQQCFHASLSGKDLPQSGRNSKPTGWSLRLASSEDGTSLPGKPAASGVLKSDNDEGCIYFTEPKVTNGLEQPCVTTCTEGEIELYTSAPTASQEPTTVPPTSAPTMRSFADNGLCPPTALLHVLEITSVDQQSFLGNSISISVVSNDGIIQQKPVHTFDFGPNSEEEMHFVCLERKTCFTPVFSGFKITDSQRPGWAIWPVPIKEENPNRSSILPIASGFAGPTNCTFAVPPTKQGKLPACPTTCTDGELTNLLDRITPTPTSAPIKPAFGEQELNYGCPTRPKMLLHEIVFLDAFGEPLTGPSPGLADTIVEVIVNYPPQVGKNDSAVWTGDISSSIENDSNYMCIQRNRCHTVHIKADNTSLTDDFRWEMRKVSYEQETPAKVAASGRILSGHGENSCTFALTQQSGPQPCETTCLVENIFETDNALSSFNN